MRGKFIDPWDNEEWHEYWITWNVAEGEKATALYVDGELTPTFSYPLEPSDPDYINDNGEMDQGGFFNRVREAEGDIPVGNAVFRITFRYNTFAPGTDEPPKEFTLVDEWSLY